MGIDFSKAFDCLNRAIIIDIIKTTEDELIIRIVQLLLANTTQQVKIQNQMGPTFNTTIGTPQGDALSPVLFILYLEAAMRTARANIIIDTPHFLTTHYADDTDFITTNYADVFQLEMLLPQILAEFDLQMNVDKTEKIVLSKATNLNIKTKKLGSLLHTDKEINRRIILANASLKKLQTLWANRKCSTPNKIKLYNASGRVHSAIQSIHMWTDPETKRHYRCYSSETSSDPLWNLLSENYNKC